MLIWLLHHYECWSTLAKYLKLSNSRTTNHKRTIINRKKTELTDLHQSKWKFKVKNIGYFRFTDLKASFQSIALDQKPAQSNMHINQEESQLIGISK